MTARIAMVLLAGGEGRRMGGRDKGLLPLRGQALFRHGLARLAPQGGWLAISANRHLHDYAAAGYPVLADGACWQGMGPLAGVATVAAQLPDDIGWLQLLPCDAPFLPADLVARQLAVLQADAQLGACYPQTAHGPHPACSLWRREALATVPTYLAQGGRSLRGLLGLLQAQPVLFDDEAAFANLNDSAALDAAG